jgi:hypothetical protein
MKFLTFKINRYPGLKEFVQFWSKRYIDPRERLYAAGINKDKFSPKDLKVLFEWKNGGKLSKKKMELVESIIDKISVVNSLREKYSQAIFNSEFRFIKGAIWRIFLLHLINQNKFPVLDQHVYRAYNFLTKGKIKEIPSSNLAKINYYNNVYINFFNGLVGMGVDRKRLDEALWAFGKYLKTPYSKIL